jgi:AcrR family transcriptional regulator
MSELLETDETLAATRDGTTSAAAREMRRRIVEKASELFHHYGYQKTTVADIARELGMSPANVYRFFSSKAELTKAVTLLVTGGLREAMERGIEKAPGSAADKLRRMVRQHFHHTRDSYTADRKIHDLLEAAMEEAWDEIEVHKAQMRASFARLIREGIGSGEFPEQDVETAAMLFQHSLVMFFHPALVAQTCRCLPEGHQDLMFDPMVDFALAALRDGRFGDLPAELRSAAPA